MNAGAWIGMIGGLVGISVAIAAVLATGGPTGIYIAAGIVLVFGGMMFLFYKILFAPMLLASRLRKTGIRGKATIREVHDTGVTVNNSPQVKLVLDVKNMYGQSYTTTLRTLVSRIQPNLYQPGMVVPVLIDPNDEKKLVIDYEGDTDKAASRNYSSKSTGDSIKEARLQEELGEMERQYELIRFSGKPARAIIKKNTWLGAYVNGNNPYVELEVEVLPDDGPAFPATVKGVIGEQAVSKYQAGCQVYVKYDAYDKSKVALDHS